MILPSDTSIFFWFTQEPEYAPQPEPQTGDGACAEGETPKSQLVPIGYRWVAHPVFLSSPNPAWDLEVQGRLERADRSALDRAREVRRVPDAPPVQPDDPS